MTNTGDNSRKVAVVLAASKGIGAATTVEMARLGYLVHTFSRSGTSPVDQPEAVAFRGDAAKLDDLAAFADAVGAVSSHVDILVNNSGHAPSGALEGLSDADWQAGFDLLFMSVVRSARLFLPMLRRAETPSIVNVSTFATIQPDADFPISSILRLSLKNLAKLFASEHAGEGLKMINVLPGFVDSYPLQEKRLTRIPAGRYATAAEIAKVVAAVSSSDMRYVNGTEFLIDGGLIASQVSPTSAIKATRTETRLHHGNSGS